MERIIALLSRLPLKVLYGIADTILYPAIYYLLRYRRKVVAKNIAICFPDLDAPARKALSKRFYHWFCDLAVETIYGYRISDAEIRERVVFHGLEEREEQIRQHGGAILYLGHLGCWEWIADVAKRFEDKTIQSHFIYLALRNRNADEAMLHLREKRGGSLIEMHKIAREMVARHSLEQPQVYCMLGDQKPAPNSLTFYTPFFGVEVPFATGTEKLSAKWNYPVYYARITMPQRGHYDITFETLSAEPAQEPKGYLTAEYARRLETNIKQQPEIWLWTHNRFKYVRELSK